ncbi:MAG: GNAT family N-acetyltransferase [Actinomycetota bacterium]
MKLVARVAGPDEAEVIAGLTTEAVDEQREARGGPVWSVRETRPAPHLESITSSLTDPDQLVVVGTIDDVIVGYGACHAEELRDGSVLGIIDDLFVLPGARGVSVGEEMMSLLVEWCRDRGCRGIDALALPGNRSTKNFFETFGFTARALVVHHRLTDD